jgi:deoxyuridine 5'-triphosphate nucleotidohydrolase
MFFTGEEPTQAFPDDAGYDLTVEGHHWIEGHSVASLPLATTIAAPEGMWGLLIGRSSTFRNRRLLVNPGILDHGYTGPLFAVVFNMSPDGVSVNHGERIAQWIPMLNVAASLDPVRVEALPDRERGHSGFGSSGR